MRRRLPDLLIFALLFVLPLIMFWAQTVGGQTLLPTENLYQFEPFATYKEVVNAPEPHNRLVSDLVLENFQWKTFIRQSIEAGEVPLWNPHQFAGIPFLAAGQQSALYPFSVLYYIMPLTAAYGWFTVVQLWLAGAFMYLFLRGLNAGRFGATVAGVIYQLSAFFVISAVFPMIIAAAAWLPLILLMAEFIIQQKPALRGRPSSLPWVVIGAGALGCNILAGHVEITYYTLLIAAYYAAARLGWRLWKDYRAKTIDLRYMAVRASWLVGMVVLGVGLGAIQFIPLFELASINYRDSRSSLEQILGWAHPLRDVVQFALPNFYGNPAHHTYFDIFSGQTVPATFNALGQPIDTIDWGIKNYVEGALYLGILPLALAIFGLIHPHPLPPSPLRREGEKSPPYRGIFALLTVVSLTFMFGLPTYILLYVLPGISQLHSPFRWIFAVTLGVAALAGFGADALAQSNARVMARRFGWALSGAGLAVLAVLALSRVFYGQIEPLIERFFQAMAKAPEAFANAQMFYSYQFPNLLIFGLALLGTGIVFWAAGRATQPRRIPLWQGFAVALTAVDLMIASWGFNPASDPALLDFTPPAIQWLQEQQAISGQFRYTTIDEPTMGERGKIMNANSGWRYGLDDVRGYDSIIPRQYVDYMGRVAPQVQLDFNRVSPLYPDQLDQVDWGRLALLNVRYIVTAKSFNLYDYLPAPLDARYGIELPAPAPVYEDEAVRIWTLPGHPPFPRVYTAQVMEDSELSYEAGILTGWEVVVEGDTGREKVLHVNVTQSIETSWLIVSETYLPGWRAFVRPRGGADSTERPLDVALTLENFQGVNVSPSVIQPLFSDMLNTLPEEQRTALENGQLTVRMNYNPASFQLGLFGSFISGVLLVFAGGIYLWRLFIVPESGQASGVAVVARNSLAPIILNLFNRGIDFGFAFIMLRILGPEGAGIYYYAAFIFGWFDIFTNFGLNVFLTREVSRDRSSAWRLLYNTSVLRFVLMGVGVILLIAFLTARQATVSPPLNGEAVVAIILLYIGLIPNSLSTGLSALFYAFEKAEIPAAITTLATICKATFGVLALALGYGVIGLAAVSILTNVVTLIVLGYNSRGMVRTPSPNPLPVHGEGEQNHAASLRPDWPLIRGMTRQGFPLMLNHFLATIFFQIDVVIIEAAHGATMVGQYSVAYKWVAALNVIPAFFTMALLPVMSRQAREDRDALKRNYGLAIKLLVSTALPLAVIFTFAAYTLTGILGGAEYLPDGAIATQLMIWSIPIGWINSLTQYVLIALDLQHRITRAFVLAVSFNIISNLILIPQYGYRAAALTTIASELALLIPFGLLLAGAVGRINWLELLWRPVAALAAMVVVIFIGWNIQPFLSLVIGGLVYIGVLLALRPLNSDELARLSPLIPGPIRARILQPARANDA